MFKKVGLVMVVIALVTFSYVILTAIMSSITEIVSTANASMPADMSAYPGGREIVTSAPLWMYFIPAIVGGIFIFMILRIKT